MKILVAYSSKTNNTKKIASVIAENTAPIYFDRVENITTSQINECDLIIIGGWIDKGTLDMQSLKFIDNINNKKVAFFFTLGAYPTSMHAYDCIEKIKEQICKGNNNIIAHFHCQGAIEPKLIEWMKTLPKEHPHSPNIDRINRWQDALLHPNEEDYHAAKSFVSAMLKRAGEPNV